MSNMKFKETVFFKILNTIWRTWKKIGRFIGIVIGYIISIIIYVVFISPVAIFIILFTDYLGIKKKVNSNWILRKE